MDFKRRFYTNYFSNQASRTTLNNLSVQHQVNCTYYQHEILKNLPDSREIKILELGAGYGSLQKFLQDAGYKNAIGIDLSEEQVQQSEKLGVKSVQVGDVFETLRNIHEIDAIIAVDLMEHFTREEALDLLELIHKALKPGGVFIARSPNVDGPIGSVFANGDLTHDLFLNKSSAEQLMLAGGFAQVTILPSHLQTVGTLKNLTRRCLWFLYRTHLKLVLFATGRSSKQIIFTPNLVMVAQKS